LGNGTTPYLLQLIEVEDPLVYVPAKNHIYLRDNTEAVEDLRDWNYADYLSDSLLFPNKEN